MGYLGKGATNEVLVSVEFILNCLNCLLLSGWRVKYPGAHLPAHCLIRCIIGQHCRGRPVLLR
jgi:hypothetical protein